MSTKIKKLPKGKVTPNEETLHLLPEISSGEVLELLQPGSFAILENQPIDLPPFQVINCKGGRCWVRQQSWGRHIHWEVEHYKLKSA